MTELAEQMNMAKTRTIAALEAIAGLATLDPDIGRPLLFTTPVEHAEPEPMQGPASWGRVW
jgi:hypothetical protein